jgi:hypothetical protein
MSTEGLKFDQNKQGWFALPLEILEPLADVFTYGEEKYEAFNCLNPFDQSNRRFWNATMRHLKASQLDPLSINPEDGNVYHLAQVAFSVLMRLHHAIKERGHNDDYLSKGNNEEGLPDTSCSALDYGISQLERYGIFEAQIQLNNDIKEFLGGFVHTGGPANTILRRDGLTETYCDDGGCSCHHTPRTDGYYRSEGKPGKSKGRGRPRKEQGSVPGAGKTLGKSVKSSNVPGSAIRANPKRTPERDW